MRDKSETPQRLQDFNLHKTNKFNIFIMTAVLMNNSLTLMCVLRHFGNLFQLVTPAAKYKKKERLFNLQGPIANQAWYQLHVVSS